MGAWYWIGVCAGLGVAVGVLISTASGLGSSLRFVAPLVVAALGVGAMRVAELGDWAERIVGFAGLLIAAFSAAPLVIGALRRGGTRGGIAILVAGAALVVATLAFVPVAGYVEALALPVLALRIRSKQPERYAGLRTLAKD